jgi:hypothetical protein
VVFSRPGADLQVPVAPLDELLAEFGIPRVDFMKFDIEGAEPQALRGAKGTLQRHQPRIVIATENYPDEDVALTKLLREIVPGYNSRNVSCLYNGAGTRVITGTTVFEVARR